MVHISYFSINVSVLTLSIEAVSEISTTADYAKLSISTSTLPSFLSDAHEGDSIAVNGTCLTITSFTPTFFTVGVAPETLRRTNLGGLKADSPVNLERAVLASTRMGGHFVQGHVDTIAEIVDKQPDGDAITFRLRPREKEVLKYIVEKGFIALDGASLTITGTKDDWFEVMLITYTQDKVVTTAKAVGDGVNVEVDMVGKYVEKCVVGYLEGGETQGMLGGLIDKAVQERLAKP